MILHELLRVLDHIVLVIVDKNVAHLNRTVHALILTQVCRIEHQSGRLVHVHVSDA